MKMPLFLCLNFLVLLSFGQNKITIRKKFPPKPGIYYHDYYIEKFALETSVFFLVDNDYTVYEMHESIKCEDAMSLYQRMMQYEGDIENFDGGTWLLRVGVLNDPEGKSNMDIEIPRDRFALGIYDLKGLRDGFLLKGEYRNYKFIRCN